MKLSDITPIQILGGILVVNTVLAGGTAQLTDLFGATMANHILSISILGSGICGGFIMNMGGLPSQVRNVLAMPGVEKIDVNGQASAALATLAVDPAQNKISPTPAAMDKVAATAKAATVILIAFLLSALIAPSAFAQGKIARDIDAAVKKLNTGVQQQVAAVTTQKADPVAALPCMDIKMLVKLTPENLVPTMKACVQDLNNQLISDTSRALDSAKTYTTTGSSAAIGDNDAVNCLTPALALFKAAAIVPAVVGVDAVLNTDGSVKVPAVAATPELDPGPVLLFQKYREFTLAGALTSCQAWFNGPINATTAAGVAGVGTAVAGAALLAPK